MCLASFSLSQENTAPRVLHGILILWVSLPRIVRFRSHAVVQQQEMLSCTIRAYCALGPAQQHNSCKEAFHLTKLFSCISIRLFHHHGSKDSLKAVKILRPFRIVTRKPRRKILVYTLFKTEESWTSRWQNGSSLVVRVFESGLIPQGYLPAHQAAGFLSGDGGRSGWWVAMTRSFRSWRGTDKVSNAD